MIKGKFITIDGVEGAGKSTQIDYICKYLRENNINITVTREPGGTNLGEKIREILLSNSTDKIHSDTELMLMFAARNEHIQNKIIPALELGEWVLSDRFSDASYAYQGGGRGLDIERITRLEKWVLRDFSPDLTLLLDVPVEIGMQRIESRGKKDRIEQEDINFFNRVRAAYIDRAKQYPNRIKRIDATQSIQKTTNNIYSCLDDLLKPIKIAT